jgi:hypothetical protein
LLKFDSCDFVIVVSKPELPPKYDTRKANPVVAAELKLIHLRVRQTTEYSETVLPLLEELQASMTSRMPPASLSMRGG